MRREVPDQAQQALEIILRELGPGLVGAYLFGSAVSGGLRPHSDIDVLFVIDRRTSAEERRKLGTEFMRISGNPGAATSLRPLEATVLCRSDFVPWHYPPRHELLYGEWLRNDFADGRIPEPAANPDLTVVLTTVRIHSVTLYGPDAAGLFDPVPQADLRKAIADTLPQLLASVRGDERNVLLTLARMWMTVTTGAIESKDEAARWALPRLPPALQPLLDRARRAYLGECREDWERRQSELATLVSCMTAAIEEELSPRKEGCD